MGNKELKLERSKELLLMLEERFVTNINRHYNVNWLEIKEKLENNPNILWTIDQMELTGGEPDLVIFNNEYYYVDCSKESPTSRRSICYDREALDARANNKPSNDAMTMANLIGIEILTEEQYRILQKFGNFDLKTSSWIKTPQNIRKLGGALFCDRRYDTVFVYHNGADSYYSARGFRGLIKICSFHDKSR